MLPRRAGAIGPVLGAMLVGGAASAAPPTVDTVMGEGEGRSLLRDVDMPRSYVAGEADGASVAMNPAAMGFLRAFSGVFAGSLTRAASQRRGSGFGVFVAVPLGLRLFGQKLGDNFLSLGAGYQLLAPAGWGRVDAWPVIDFYDNDWLPSLHVFHKFTLAAAVPLMRWVPGLSLGFSYARLWSPYNVYADGLNQFDASLAYRPSRYVTIGAVARAFNAPVAGADVRVSDPPRGIVDRHMPFEFDAEVAVRPIKGSPRLEIGAGARVVFNQTIDARFYTPHVAPRGRVAAGGQSWRVFAEAERYFVNPAPRIGIDAIKAMLGVEVDFSHVGVAAAPIGGPTGAAGYGAQGGAFKLRVSAERYPTLAMRPHEGVRFDLAKYGGDRGAARLIEAMDLYSERRGERAVIALEVDGLANGWGEVEELREAVLRARRRGGKVIVYLRAAGLREYMLAAAADRIVLHPGTRLSIVGLRSEVFYYAELLERLGARGEFVRAYEYKSRPEQWERRGASVQADEQRRQVLADTWNHVLRTIAGDREATPEQVKGWIDGAPYTADQALRLGLVDAVGYADELDAQVSGWLGRKVALAAPSKRALHDQAFGPGPVIAVVHVEGTIAEGDSLEIPIVGSKIAGGRTLVRAIDALRDDRRVRAVVVRIDSPGGSVAASDDMARALDRVALKKPVIVSFGDVAASGGYYVATAGSYIFADATTRTGSIGVFRPKVDLSGTLAKFGVNVESVNLGAKAGLYTWFSPYTPEERAAAQAGVDASYQEFIGRVARARKMTLAQVDGLARGRVWTGVRAKEIGLVDAYGGLAEAIAYARAQARMGPREGEVRHVPGPPGLGEQISAIFGLKLPSPLGIGESALIGALRRLPPSLWLSDRAEDLALAEEALFIE